MRCCSIYTLLIIFPMTNADGVIQALPKTGRLIRPHALKTSKLCLSFWRLHAVRPPVRSPLCHFYFFYFVLSKRLVLNSYHIWFNYSTKFISPSCFSSLPLPLEHLLSLWSTGSCHPSFSLTIFAPSPPLLPPPPSLLLFPSLPPLLLLPSSSLFLFSLWSALRGLFIQQQPTQSGAEQNRAAKAVWLAKKKNGHHLQKRNKTLPCLYFFLLLFILCPSLHQFCSCLLASPQVCCAYVLIQDTRGRNI